MAITAADIGLGVPPDPSAQRHLGVVAPFGLSLDRELWRGVPDDGSLHVGRTPFYAVHVGVEIAATVSDVDDVRDATRTLTSLEPEVVAYACTSGSFLGGLAGEELVRRAMCDGGAARAVTAS